MTADTKTPKAESSTRRQVEWLQENRSRITVLAVLVFLLLAAMSGLERDDWFATIMQGLSVGALTFLVASGLSLIFGLMDVLNLAHGEIFMLGAYVGWTVYTRFDTAVDAAVPLLLVVAPFALLPLWRRLATELRRLDAVCFCCLPPGVLREKGRRRLAAPAARSSSSSPRCSPRPGTPSTASGGAMTEVPTASTAP